MRIRLLLLLLCSILVLSSCSSRQFGYRYAETLISWQAGSYVSLTDEQDALLRREAETFLQWHAENHMPGYHQLLTDVQRTLKSPKLDSEKLLLYRDRAANYWFELREELLHPSVRLLTTLSDEQAVELLQNMEERLNEQSERLEKIAAEVDNGNENYAQQRRAERFLDTFRKYAGRPTNAQIELIEEWSKQAPVVNDLWFKYQQTWHDEFVSVIQQRVQDDFMVMLSELFLYPEQYRSAEMNEKLSVTNQESLKLLMALHINLTDRQRSRLNRRIDRLRNDLQGMMEQRGIVLEE